MIAFIEAHQLNSMLVICGACGILVFLLLLTRFLSKNRKRILILMELLALHLLWFDRLAYIYAGYPGRTGYVMVRVSNFMVFFLTSGIVFGFNLYLMDWLSSEGKLRTLPLRLKFVSGLSAVGMLLAVISVPMNLYYYFDEMNRYHRGPGFLVAYIIPVVCPLVQYSVVRQYRKIFGRLIYISLVLYIFVPIVCGIIQIFTYGISIVNMAMVAVSIFLYVFSYIDMNNTVVHAHNIEILTMQDEKKRMQDVLNRISLAFISELEEKDSLTKGKPVRAAEYAKRIAQYNGKDDDYCAKAYYTALFDAVGLFSFYGKILDFQDREADEMERIAKVATACADMTMAGKEHDALPLYMAREELVKGAGEKFDAVFADTMVKIIDADGKTAAQDFSETEEIRCGEYRDKVSQGIEIGRKIKKISFVCIDTAAGEKFSAPSIILFDSFDRRVHSDDRTIDAYHYLEYGELWFDEHMITTAARKMEVVKVFRREGGADGSRAEYEMTAFRVDDHIKLTMRGPELEKEIIVALPNRTMSSYIGLTGEHCTIQDIAIETVESEAGAEDIPRIVGDISYINHLESDIKNVQVDKTRSASTQGIALENRLRIAFHSMSLPAASLIWHCPYVVLYWSKDGSVGGEGYQEYALIKLNGETECLTELAQTKFRLKKKDGFPGWDAWKFANREGMEYEVFLEKKGNRIILRADNLGINIESTTTLASGADEVYVALTGDQVALTDIRIR